MMIASICLEIPALVRQKFPGLSSCTGFAESKTMFAACLEELVQMILSPKGSIWRNLRSCRYGFHLFLRCGRLGPARTDKFVAVAGLVPVANHAAGQE